MAKDKKEIVEKEVKVVDEVKVDEVKVDEVVKEKVSGWKDKVVTAEGKGKVIQLTHKSATFEDGTVVKIVSRKQHNELKKLR